MISDFFQHGESARRRRRAAFPRGDRRVKGHLLADHQHRALGREVHDDASVFRRGLQIHFREGAPWLLLLDQVVEKYPTFAEGWNRRASVYWQMGEYGKSIADSRQTLILNPNHYGAWQGIGICRLKTGDVAEACRCLRAALKIVPYDEATRNSLERCEGLLRRSPQPTGKSQPMDLI